jgi:hypothetical protein
MTIKPGDVVECSYRSDPYPSGVPHRGTALALDDARAWAGTVYADNPAKGARGLTADAHGPEGRTPVLWLTFQGGPRVYWDRTGSLVAVVG